VGIELVAGRPGQVGAKYTQKLIVMGKNTTAAVELVEVDHDERLVFRSTGGPTTIKITYKVNESAGGTRVRVDFDAGVMSAAMRPIVGPTFEKGLAALKALLEEQREGEVSA